MAGQSESSDEKTEQPTERRLEKAFQEGEIQLARDPFLFAMVLCGENEQSGIAPSLITITG